MKDIKDNYFIEPQKALPELNYRVPKKPERNCGNCIHGYTTRPGACIPGWGCKLMEKLWIKKGHKIYEPPCIYSEVDQVYGICDEWRGAKQKIKNER